MTAGRIPLADLHLWDSNPRIIKDKRFKALCKSLTDDPAFMELRPILLQSMYRWYKMGNMTVQDRFWAKVEKGDGCWEWKGAIKNTGYGVFQIGTWGASKIIKAHRYSWELSNGKIPDGLWVLHKCDNRKCVRPDHLFLGDAFANMSDCAAKGRLGSQIHPEARPRGASHWKSTLTQEEVDLIRERRKKGERTKDLAEEYGVGRHTISNVVLFHTWK